MTWWMLLAIPVGWILGCIIVGTDGESDEVYCARLWRKAVEAEMREMRKEARR